MASSYLIFQTKDEAVARSREAWEQVLGRKKNPEDVTEFLWAVDVGKDWQASLVITNQVGVDRFDKAAVLDVSEISASVASLPTGKGENWEKATLQESK